MQMECMLAIDIRGFIRLFLFFIQGLHFSAYNRVDGSEIHACPKNTEFLLPSGFILKLYVIKMLG